MAMLEVKDLHVHYGVIEAIKGISFEVEQGEVIALIGANGASLNPRENSSYPLASHLKKLLSLSFLTSLSMDEPAAGMNPNETKELMDTIRFVRDHARAVWPDQAIKFSFFHRNVKCIDSIIAAVLLTLLPEVLRGLSDYRMLIYAIVLIIMMIFNWSPNAIFFRKRLKQRLTPGSRKKEA